MNDMRRLIVLCFLPDRGHVQPLLNLASAMSEEVDLDIECLLPAEFGGLVKSFGFSWRPLALGAPRDLSALLARVTARSHFRNAFSCKRDLHQSYWLPLASAVSQILPSVIEHVKRARPAMVLADAHLFGSWYSGVAGGCEARLVLHQALAPLAFDHRVYERSFGYRSSGVLPVRFVELLGAGWKMASRFSGVAGHPIRAVQAQWAMRQVQSAAAQAFAKCPRPAASPDLVHCGVGALECLLLPPEVERRARFVLVSPRRDGREGVPPELVSWIDQQRRPVIYVCFGTMTRLGRQMVETMAQGFIDAEVSTIWVLPDHGAATGPTGVPPDRFRIERYLPQAEVLALEKIAAFVGCGGSGSVIEALGHGHPVLSIPFMWDQNYNASVVARLGAGVVLDKRKLSADAVCRAVRHLIATSSYSDQARRIEGMLRVPPEEFAVASCIESLGLRV